MPFLKGAGALRRTAEYLRQGKIIFRNDVRIVSFGFNPGPKYPHHAGLENFVFWHLPQLKYKNRHAQFVSFKYMTPTPWIKVYHDDDSQMVIDCHGRTREEIHDHLLKVLGKPRDVLHRERQAELEKTSNPANFGFTYPRECICEVPGQFPCPGWKTMPKEMTGKYRRKMAEEARENS